VQRYCVFSVAIGNKRRADMNWKGAMDGSGC